jgi:hypothetical protein
VHQVIQQIFLRSYPEPPVSKGRELGRQKVSRIRKNEMGRKDEGRGGGDAKGGKIVSVDWWHLN